MAKITATLKDKEGRAVEIKTVDDKGVESRVILTADFCHYCKDDLATEFEAFMKAKGYDIRSNK